MGHIMKLTSLTQAVLRHQCTGTGGDDLVRRIALEIYTYPRRRLGWEEDDCSDFFSYFYPKLPALIRRFTYQGKPFEAYLCTTLKWQLKTFAARKHLNAVKSRVVSEEGFGGVETLYSAPVEAESLEIAESSPVYPEKIRRVFHIEPDGVIRNEVWRKRILFLTMKGAFDLDAPTVDRVAGLTGYERNWLAGCAQELVARMATRHDRLHALCARRNHAYFRIYYLHERLSSPNSPANRDNLLRILSNERKRLSRAIDDINRVPRTPTHHDIAEVLEVPKGSVDSALYYLRNQLRKHGIFNPMLAMN